MNIVRSIWVPLAALLLVACSNSGYAEPIQSAPDEPSKSDAPRIVAVGDVHGDFDQFSKLLAELGLIDKKQNWSGGNTHLVQLGDIPDRGPDTRKAMDMLINLEQQAKEHGGAVTVLIGNHDAMMLIGDLRYVHPGEYVAFRDRHSKKRRAAYYKQTIDHIKATLSEREWPTFDREYRRNWESRFPLGYVEHRLAWSPTGEYGKWVLSRPAVAKVGDSLFVHAGISPEYAEMSINEINTRVRTALAMGERIGEDSIVEVSNGPLWDRGWISRLQNQENTALLKRVLSNFGVKRMVVGHTPVASVIIPRFGGQLLLADVGLSAHYGGGSAAVEIVGDNAYMLLESGERLALPTSPEEIDGYLDAAEKISDQPEKIIRYRQLIKAANAGAKPASSAKP